MNKSAIISGEAKGRSRSRLRKQPHQKALTRVELLVMLALLGVIAVMTTPLFGNTALRTQRAVCVNNLRQIAVGFRAFALNNQGKYPWIINNNGALSMFFRDAAAELGTPRILVCPSDFVQAAPNPLDFTNFNSLANLSYFVNRSAQEHQSHSWLSGDRNLSAIGSLTSVAGLQWNAGNNHETEGNIVLVDGHVQQLDKTALPASATAVLSNAYGIYILRPR